MRITKWLGVAAAITLFLSCFFPWITIESKHIVVSGVASEGTSLGKPGYFHFFMLALYFISLLIPKNWTLFMTICLCAINLGWAVRNVVLLTTCQAGECPVKHTALYLLIPASLLMLIASLFPATKQPLEELKGPDSV